MLRILTIVGARPQFIKAAVMSRYFASKENIAEVIVHTGQHFDANMSSVFFDELSIPTPKYNLNINNSTHGNMTGRMLWGIEEILLKEKPDYLLVYGDTNSTLAGALAAAKLHIPIIHIEAGLRSFNMNMPEEINRILTDRLSRLLCCPTEVAIQNLKQEGFDRFACTYLNTGDVMEDAVRFYEKTLSEESLPNEIKKLTQNPFILCTLHREENTNNEQRLQAILSALQEVSKQVTVVFPVHPRTKAKVASLANSPSIQLIEPVGYKANLYLQKKSELIITDSGGMQKEAYFLKKFCLTVRDETEWTELVTTGCNVICGADKNKILAEYERLQKRTWNFPAHLYGGGKAADTIFNAITSLTTT